jgi:hypothetical protein
MRLFTKSVYEGTPSSCGLDGGRRMIDLCSSVLISSPVVAVR